MLNIPMKPREPKAADIVQRFINDRLIALMEGIILDESAWNRAIEGDLDFDENGAAESESFEEAVDLEELMHDRSFAETISMMYLPEGFPVERANREFFGLYRLLKAKKEYVPELVMEYILYHIIKDEINQIDDINEFSEAGVFDELIGDPLFEGIGDKEYSTVEQIPEPERSIVLAALESEADPDTTAESLIKYYEDLREYVEVCFWDADFAFLDEMDEDELSNSALNEYMGIIEKEDRKIIEFPSGGKKSTNIKAELNIFPWDMEDE